MVAFPLSYIQLIIAFTLIFIPEYKPLKLLGSGLGIFIGAKIAVAPEWLIIDGTIFTLKDFRTTSDIVMGIVIFGISLTIFIVLAEEWSKGKQKEGEGLIGI